MTTTELGPRPQDTHEHSIYLLHLAAGMGGCGPDEFEDENWQLPATRVRPAVTMTAAA
jgi:hypothetical protein